MELDAPDGKGFVADAHDFAFVGFGGDFEAVGEGFFFDDERVVAGGGERIGHVLEEVFVVVPDGGRFAVHHAVVDNDVAAEGVADALVAQADAEDGDFAGEVFDDVVGEAGFARGAGAGGDENAVGVEFFDAGEGDLVVAVDLHGNVHFAQVLDEVVGERIVVIEHEHHAMAR